MGSLTGDSWAEAAILGPLSVLYSYVGRFADARVALTRSRSILARSGARIDWARRAIQGGLIELIAGDPVAAEQAMTPGYDALRVMGERGWRASLATLLAEAVYAQGRLDQALRLTEEAEECAGADDFDAQARWPSRHHGCVLRFWRPPIGRAESEEPGAVAIWLPSC